MAFATVTFFSDALSRTTSFNVVLPGDKRVLSGTGGRVAGPYKTLYLLHGIYGSQGDWQNYTRILSLAAARDLCVVMPSGDNKFYCDSDISGDHYSEFISRDLVAFTRRAFNLSQRREDTFIGGLSMGGFGAIVNGLRHPGTFSRIVAFSSALIKDRIINSSENKGGDFYTRRQYETMFNLKDASDFEGSVNDYDALASRTAAAVLAGGAAARRAAGLAPEAEHGARAGISGNDACSGDSAAVLPSFYMACGAQDPLLELNTAYRDRLEKLGYEVKWDSWEGAHNWVFWDKAIEKALDWLPLGGAVEGKSSGNVAL